MALLLPGDETGWDLWECTASGAMTKVSSFAHPADWREGSKAPSVVGLPASRCLTITFDFPVHADGTMVRRMVFGQLEKRGLLARGNTPETAPFACHPVGGGPDGGTRLSVDVLSGELPPSERPAGTRSFAAALRLFTLPDDTLVLLRQHGHWVVAAGRDGIPVFAQVLGTTVSPAETLVADLRATALTLESRGWLTGDVRRVQIWDDAPPDAASRLAGLLGIPVEAPGRPAPDGTLVRQIAKGAFLLPKPHLEHQRRRRDRSTKLLVAAGVVLALVAIAAFFHHKLGRLEARAAALETELAASADGASAVTKAGKRWRELRYVLEPKRYPLVHLDHLTRLMPDQGIVMSSFDSKVSELRFTGIAADAKSAYAYFNAIRDDDALGVYNWSMDRPNLDDTGTARFEIKGTMR